MISLGTDGKTTFSVDTEDDMIDEMDGEITIELVAHRDYVVSDARNMAHVTVTDNDIADIADVTVTESDGSTLVTETAGTGRTDTYTIALNSEPTHAVTVTITSRNMGAALVHGPGTPTAAEATLTFTPLNWNTEQTVTVTGVDDNVDQSGDRSVAISHTTASEDPNYNGIVVSDVTVTVVDNDVTVGPPSVVLKVTDPTATEGDASQTARITLTLPRGGLSVEQELGVPLLFFGGRLGTDFTLALDGDPHGVTLEDGIVTFRGCRPQNPSPGFDDRFFARCADDAERPASVAVILLTATSDSDVANGTLTVSIPASSLNGEPRLIVKGAERATGSRDGDGQIIIAEPQNLDEFTYRLCARDHQNPDGDRVDVYVNEQPVFSNLELSSSEECREITLRRNPSRNTIRVRAINVGQPEFVGNPPQPNVNTAALRIRHAISGSLAPLAGDEWRLSAGQQQGWSVYAVSENQVTLSPIATGAPQRQAVQGTVAGVAAATVSNVTSNIGARFSAPSAPTGGVSVSLAGTPLSFDAVSRKHPGSTSVVDRFDAFDESRQVEPRSLTGGDLLRSSSFAITLGASETDDDDSAGFGGQVTIWGRGDLQFFESGGGRKSGYDGDLLAGYLGVDLAMDGGWLGGVAVSRIAAEADYTLAGSSTGGTLEADLTSFHPYVRVAVGNRSEGWAILGIGAGEVTDSAQTGSESKSDLSMRMASAGMRHQLTTDAGLDWAVLGDGSLARVETDDGARSVDGISADVWRTRLGVEASHTKAWEDGSSLTSFLEVAGRKDGGDSVRGEGIEVSPGLAFGNPASGFAVEARGRALVLHSADNHREYGASLTASLTPSANGRGLSISVAPTWGTPGHSFNATDADLFSTGPATPGRESLSLNSRVAYGFAAGRGTLAPFAEFSLHDGEDRRIRLGSRYSLGSTADLELYTDRRSGEAAGRVAHSVQLGGRIRF